MYSVSKISLCPIPSKGRRWACLTCPRCSIQYKNSNVMLTATNRKLLNQYFCTLQDCSYGWNDCWALLICGVESATVEPFLCVSALPFVVLWACVCMCVRVVFVRVYARVCMCDMTYGGMWCVCLVTGRAGGWWVYGM